ncbi:MAG: HEPN domain-containing protein [Gammaproteobacteria bacterium]|nr:HEPN domain-containing protein [Gammaproteobacteria bacterium]
MPEQKMPSEAFGTCNHNRIDVHRLVEAYNALKQAGKGKRGLGHLTRSTIVTLCACWEQYIEDVIIEGVECLKTQIDHPDQLPLGVRKQISKKVKAAKHELKPLELAGEGWKEIYSVYAKDEVGRLHSPKTENIKELFFNYLGFTDQIEEKWACGKKGVDDFVNLRNLISHKGRSAGKYTKFWEVGSSIKLIADTVIETDNALSDYLKGVLPEGRPWNRVNK